jgi:hypothetical protein
MVLSGTTDSAYQDDVNVKGSPEHQSTPKYEEGHHMGYSVPELDSTCPSNQPQWQS